MSVTAQTITRNDLRVYAFTRDHVMRGTIDHVFNHDPVTAVFLGKDLGAFGDIRMRGSGKVSQTGGAAVQIRVRLGKHSGSKWMAGPWDTHNVTPDDNVRLAEANWVHASGALVITDYDKGVNRGPEAMDSFVADQTESVMLALADQIGAAIQTTSSATNSITSLDSLIAAGSATVQGLAVSSYAQYASRGLSARGVAPGSVSFASGAFATQGISDMRTLYNNASEGTIQPNFIATTYASHEAYEGALQPLERFQGAVNVADASFGSLAFRTTPVVASPNTPTGLLWMLRVGEDGVGVRILDGFDFNYAPFKDGSNQETHVSELQWKGQLVIMNRQYGSNKMTGIT